MTLTRRQLLAGGAGGVGLAIAGTLPSLGAGAAAAATPDHGRGPATRGGGRPFPALVEDPDGILALPEGFSYRIVSHAGQTDLVSGLGKTPSNHDGTAVFRAPHGLRLIQNHELGAWGSDFGVPHVPGTTYDPGAEFGGGCTVIDTDRNGKPRAEWVGISGTAVNCAGGPTPWGTWLTCEETELKAGAAWSSHGHAGTYQMDHGYVFEVFPDRDDAPLPKPIKAFGRYAHEALAVEPSRRRVYLSEDASSPNGLFYRWTAPAGVELGPRVANQLSDTAGTLAAMPIRMDDGSVLPDVAYLTSAQLGRPFPVTWLEVAERDGQSKSVRKQFATTGEVTRGKKFEGVWSNGRGVYIVNSFAFGANDLPADATKHDGMVWFYDFEDETITLVTYFPHQPTAENGVTPKYSDMTFDGPDNVTVTPWGSLVLAEDGAGASHVLSATPGGPTYAIARNQLNIGTDAAPEYSEFTGPTFTEDGRILFVNIQVPGITLAITGPWERYLG